MSARGWRATEMEDAEVVALSAGSPGLVTLHFIRTAVRRLWFVWVTTAVLGTIVGAGFGFLVPPASTATTTLYLAHEPGTDPAAGMATDVTLMRTRTVASELQDRLGLDSTPEDIQASITLNPVTSAVLVVHATGPDDRSAVARARALVEIFLAFRAEQLQARSEALLSGYRAREESLRERIEGLNTQYDSLRNSGPEGRVQASAVLTQRAQLDAEVNRIQQSVEETTLHTHATVAASHVIDPATLVLRSPLKRGVLATASGMIGGTGLGVCLVLLLALTSQSLRRREDVALALSAPVRFSAGGLRGRRWPVGGRSPADRDAELQMLAGGLEELLSPRRSRQTRLVIGGVGKDAGADVELIATALAIRLAASGQSVFIADLTERGRIGSRLLKQWAHQPAASGAEQPYVLRPDDVPVVATGPLGNARSALSDDSEAAAAWERTGTILTVVDLDPAVSADNLRSWGEKVAVVVHSGRSTAERLNAVAELVRCAGLHLISAILVGSDRRDDSSGLVEMAEHSTPLSTQTGSDPR